MSDFRETHPEDDFTVATVQIAMRDGVMLNTVIVAPKVGAAATPVLLLRTPYGAAKYLRWKNRPDVRFLLGHSMAELEGYTFVYQDMRGRNGSGGLFELSRPPRGPYNGSDTDETTDAWDTIEWLVRSGENNGRVGMLGTSYEGWATLMALLNPHPALAAAVPVSPLVDGWIGDDWFHRGAFRLGYAFEYVYTMESDSNSYCPFPYDQYDTYAWWLKAGSPAEVGRRYLDPARHRFWQTLLDNPHYSEYWQRGSLEHLLTHADARAVPTLHVHEWFDQEDIYGAPAAYAAMRRRDAQASSTYFAAGPWFHGQAWMRGDKTGALNWGEDTGRRWRADALAPFLAHYLKDAAPHDVAPASVFNTGTRRWERFDCWPPKDGARDASLFLQPNATLAWAAPAAPEGTSRAYLSDPAHPVPHQPRPVRRIFDDEVTREAWRTWLTVDQRFVDGRPDVLTFVSEALPDTVTVRGAPQVVLQAETDGSDADWIVKLIDVFPDLDPSEPEMSGYQAMIAGEIMRGRYREDHACPHAITPGAVLEYRLPLPQLNHSFLKGHRIMVQIQSSWFPLYDRNPQQYVPDMMSAGEQDFREARHRIHCNAVHASRIELRCDR